MKLKRENQGAIIPRRTSNIQNEVATWVVDNDVIFELPMLVDLTGIERHHAYSPTCKARYNLRYVPYTADCRYNAV